jgi:hypothetical protein
LPEAKVFALQCTCTQLIRDGDFGMNVVTAIYRNGRLELISPVDWPEGTSVEVKPVTCPRQRPSWLSLPPLDVGRFQEVTGDDDLLGEMLDDSRS